MKTSIFLAGVALLGACGNEYVDAAQERSGGVHCEEKARCHGIVKVDCGAQVDGPLHYFDEATVEVISVCRGACFTQRSSAAGAVPHDVSAARVDIMGSRNSSRELPATTGTTGTMLGRSATSGLLRGAAHEQAQSSASRSPRSPTSATPSRPRFKRWTGSTPTKLRRRLA